MKTIWMAVTQDDMELPIAIADTAKELAALVGVKHKTVLDEYRKAIREGIKPRYLKVCINDLLYEFS